MNRLFGVVLAAATALPLVSHPVRADDGDYDAAVLAAVIDQARVPLTQALAAGQAYRWPVSAQYELDNGALRLAVYTVRNGEFTQIIIDYVSGTVRTTGPVQDPEGLDDARRHEKAMNIAHRTLVMAVEDAERTHSG